MLLEDLRFNLQLFADGDEGGDSGVEPSGGVEDPGVEDPGSGDPGGGGEPAEEMIPKSQVEAAIRARIAQAQKGMGTQAAELQRHKSIVDRISRITGQSVEAIEAQLEGMALEIEAQQYGVSPQAMQAFTQVNQALQQTQMSNRQMQLELEENKLKANPLYAQALEKEEIQNRVRTVALQTGLPLEQAFWLSEGATYAPQMEKNIEQRIMNNIQKRGAKGNILGDQSSEAESLGLSAEEIAYCQATETDPKEYAALKNMNDIESYRSHKKKKAKA